jgi:hypothetical protein
VSLLSLLGLAGVVTAVALSVGSPARANSTISINPGNVATSAAGFGNHSCDANQGGGPYPGQDVWVFVLPGNHDTTGDFLSITANFGVNGTVTITTAANPGNFANGGPATSKAWIVTPAGWTLVGATATISGTASFFNLTHTCPASGTPGPSPSTSSSRHLEQGSPSPSTSDSQSSGSASPSTSSGTPVVPVGGVPQGGVSAGGGGGQPVGSLVWGLVALALASGASVALLLAWRRRKTNA